MTPDEQTRHTLAILDSCQSFGAFQCDQMHNVTLTFGRYERENSEFRTIHLYMASARILEIVLDCHPLFPELLGWKFLPPLANETKCRLQINFSSGHLIVEFSTVALNSVSVPVQIATYAEGKNEPIQ